MFERYVRNINPDDAHFKAFISKYVEEKLARDPNTTPYSELYKVIRNGIREYLGQQESEAKK